MIEPYEYRETWQTPAGPLDIAPIAEGDEHDLLRFFRERLSERSNYFLCLYADRSDEEALDAMRLRILEHRLRRALVYLARQHDEVVGYFFLSRLGATDGPPPSLGIGLADRLHGNGIGGRCMDLLIEVAGALGYRQITLSHHPDNHRAAALYRRKGFRYTGETVVCNTRTEERIEPRMILDLE